jgi:GDP-L-fucose synthase
MDPQAKIYVAGHRGLVGSALVRALRAQGYENLLLRSHAELDLLDQAATARFFAETQPDVVFLAAAKVGGIHANNVYRGQFIYENLMMQVNVIHQAYLAGVKRLIFLGSSCIYPQLAPSR